jgi:hypothetical protein
VTEKLKYQLIQRLPDFEVREYPDHTLITVTSRGEFMPAGNRAFGPLVSFISGNNADSMKIAMTAPVLQQPVAEQLHEVSFVLPDNLEFEQVPLPRNASVVKKLVPRHFAAVRSFRGGWDEARFKSEGELLQRAVREAGLKASGNLYWARFDPPWKPGFLKQNEVLIDLEGLHNED